MVLTYLKYKISISGSTTEDDQGDSSPEYKTQESTVTIQTVTSQQPEREPVDMRNFNATLDVHGDKTSHTFSKVWSFIKDGRRPKSVFDLMIKTPISNLLKEISIKSINM